MENSNIQSLDTTKSYLAVGVLLSAIAFFYFKGLEPWILLLLFSVNGFVMAFVDKQAKKTGHFLFWGLGMKALKSLVLFFVLGLICILKAVDNVPGFAVFFCLGFCALMILEVLHLKKEFGDV